MSVTQSAIEQFDKERGIKQLTNLDNTGLYCNSNHYSKKTKRVVIEQTSKWARKGDSHAKAILVRADQSANAQVRKSHVAQ